MRDEGIKCTEIDTALSLCRFIQNNLIPSSPVICLFCCVLPSFAFSLSYLPIVRSSVPTGSDPALAESITLTQPSPKDRHNGAIHAACSWAPPSRKGDHHLSDSAQLRASETSFHKAVGVRVSRDGVKGINGKGKGWDIRSGSTQVEGAWGGR
jgi:hypothetical protein